MKPFLKFLLVVCLFIPVTAQAQRRDMRHMGMLMVGWQHLDLDSFNGRLAAVSSDQYPAEETDVVTVGGAGFGIHKRAVFGAEGAMTVGQRGVTGVRQNYTRLMGGYGLLEGGFTAVDRKGWLVYPTVGVGGGVMTYSITPSAPAPFGSVVNNPGRSTRMSAGALIVGLRLGVQHNFRVRPRRGMTGEGGIVVGVRGGYNIAPVHGRWRETDGAQITGGPTVTAKGPVVVLTLGGWRLGPRLR